MCEWAAKLPPVTAILIHKIHITHNQKYVDKQKEAALAIAEQAQTAALSPHEQLIAKWLKIIQGEKNIAAATTKAANTLKNWKPIEAGRNGRTLEQPRQTANYRATGSKTRFTETPAQLVNK